MAACHGNLIEYHLEPRPAVGREKVGDEAAIELAVAAKAQWALQRQSGSHDVQPPLSQDNLLLMSCQTSKIASRKNKENNDAWLSQVSLNVKKTSMEILNKNFLLFRLRLSPMLALIAAFGWVLSSLLRRTPLLKDLMAPLSGKQWKLEQVGGLLGLILSTCPAVALFLCSSSLVLAVSGFGSCINN